MPFAMRIAKGICVLAVHGKRRLPQDRAIIRMGESAHRRIFSEADVHNGLYDESICWTVVARAVMTPEIVSLTSATG